MSELSQVNALRRKELIQQARGKGGPTYRAPSFKYKGQPKYGDLTDKKINGTVIEIWHGC